MRIELACLLLLTTASCFVVVPIPASGGGCDGEAGRLYPAADVVRVMATDELECDTVQVTSGVAGTYRAEGCGKRASFSCEDDAVGGCSLEDAAERGGCERK
ncbi:MAG: hypothetical protein KC776_20990 [Myxococcales bacterium]|nr:hypothetical protein [Myxococcales bacterium]